MPLDSGLEQAFETRADGVSGGGAPLVGLFGEGIPLALIACFGGLAVDIKAPPLSDAHDGPQESVIDKIAEPFLDPFATRFLHRLAAGMFDRFAMLIFARDDSAALAAYQYASELRRQGRLSAKGPRFFLWNLLHSGSKPATAFNRTELERLKGQLAQTFGSTLEPDRLANAITAENHRAAALRALPSGGAEAFVALNAGRWMTPEAHRASLPDLSVNEGPRIALVGTACDIAVLHEIGSEFGQIVADLQDYGRPAALGSTAAELLSGIVEDSLSPRATPAERFSRALQDSVAKADLVIASVDTNDDSFGWELPGLRRAAAAGNARFLDLGFRPFRPDDAWRDKVRIRIAEALR